MGCEVLRWDGERWRPYTTQPQRNLDGQMVFQLLDPDGVYDYYAKLAGLCLSEWLYDTKRLADLSDPRTVPEPWIPLLGDNFGLIGDTQYPPDRQRVFIRQFVELMRAKGIPQAIVDALTILGYTGYGTHVWVIPGGSSTDYIERPFGYDVLPPPGPYHPASQVAIHVSDEDGNPIIIDDGLRQTIGDFLMRFVLPAHVRVRYFVTDVPVGPVEEISISDSLSITNI